MTAESAITCGSAPARRRTQDRERVVELEPAGLERERTYHERAGAVVERTAEPE